MKQPQLGHMIQVWRKGKGMTQEELVERCNINVRTIQRIEAGEVTPRPYTVKAILEALEVDPSEVGNLHSEDTESELPIETTWLRYAYAVGVGYLILAILESGVDVRLFMGESGFWEGFALWYVLLKLGVLIFFAFFMAAFFKLAGRWNDPLMRVTIVLLVCSTGVFILEDALTYWLETELVSGLIFRSLVTGLLYLLFATSFIKRARLDDVLCMISGALGVLTGISFLTVVFALPGLLFLTLFEVALIVVVYREFGGSGMVHLRRKNKADPQVL
ncbi:MAG: helix-turn-helix transcriptional regulator [Lunatimonas sp.]|uniref:helix-turn-helix domain-containing protein n=1 Tax=Lunatimonas sp. TaxID=2060141 RepID=UPI00263B2F37|nr:helix-turn-helix transcriptional regulator [Lunatimonas sp.]MCC5938625.1 helix-turn-helix transcriptional regulator [Lunatimonas sp.]